MRGERLRKDTESGDENSKGEKARVGWTGCRRGGVSRHFFLTMSDFYPPHFYGIIVSLDMALNLVVRHPTSEGTICRLLGVRGTIQRLVTSPKTVKWQQRRIISG
jgi:hypothetical protein